MILNRTSIARSFKRFLRVWSSSAICVRCVRNLRTWWYANCELGGTQFANLHKHNIKCLKIKNIIRARREFSFSGSGMAWRCGCGRGGVELRGLGFWRWIGVGRWIFFWTGGVLCRKWLLCSVGGWLRGWQDVSFCLVLTEF